MMEMPDESTRFASIVALAEARVDAKPAALAVMSAERSLTYRDLEREANRLAWALRGHGVGPDQLVAVCLPRSVTLVVVLLAILKAGGAYVPLSPADPPARLARLLAETRPTLLITTEPPGPDLAVPVWRLEQLPALSARQPDERPASDPHPANLAYITYTSGSTGQPKGVMVTHRGVANLADARQPMAVRSTDVVGFHSPLQFDASTYELWCTLAAGACLLVAPPDPVALADYRELASKASVLCLTPSLFNLLVDEGCHELGGLRLLNVGGEAIDPGHVDRLPGTALIMACYGPTEGTMLATAGPAAERTPDGRAPIGKPLLGCEVYLLGDDLGPTPAGETGELYLGGAGLARAYLGQPAQTAARFVADPARPGQRVYRTGDLARRLPDGELEFLGRVDDQVKLRGHRIEPAEIEHALLAHPDVLGAAVAVRPDSTGARRLAAYLVLVPGGDRARQIGEWLAQRLPEYLVPTHFVTLDSLPLNPNGKLDRLALPDLPATGHADGGGLPESRTEQLVAQVWSVACEREEVRLDDHFIDIGGDSLRALQIVAELAGHGHQVALADLFQHGTVRELAAYLDS